MKFDLRAKFENSYHPEPNTGCWLYEKVLNSDGYGVLLPSSKKTAKIKRKKIFAHRYSYEIYKGQIPEKMLVCHKCDTPSCVNPDHLFLGTDQDNTDDKMKKGRNRPGRHTYRDMNFCTKGHELTKENIYLRLRDGSRDCRICRTEYGRRYNGGC